MTDHDQIKKNQEKWKIWNEGWKRQQKNKNQNIEQNLHSYAVKIIQKLDDPDRELKRKQEKEMTQKIGTQIQSNSCSICLELMVPPQIPMILFPCGHNCCKMCLFENAHQKRQKYKLKIGKCPLCRVPINNYAINRNLMTLICMYTDNKHLLEKELEMQKEREQDSSYDDIEKLRLRCELLAREKEMLDGQLGKQKKERNILEQVIDRLADEKKKNQKEIQLLEEQSRLIKRHLDDKKEDLQLIENKIKSTEEKRRIINVTLQPLKQQKQKLQLLEAAKLINEK